MAKHRAVTFFYDNEEGAMTRDSVSFELKSETYICQADVWDDILRFALHERDMAMRRFQTAVRKQDKREQKKNEKKGEEK